MHNFFHKQLEVLPLHNKKMRDVTYGMPLYLCDFLNFFQDLKINFANILKKICRPPQEKFWSKT